MKSFNQKQLLLSSLISIGIIYPTNIISQTLTKSKINEVILVGKKNRTPILLTKKYEPILESCDNSFYCFKNSGSIFDIYKSIYKKKRK